MRRAARLHYAWIVVGLTFLVLLAGAGLRSAPAVLIVPLQNEFGWSRATISFAVAVNLMLYGLLGPFNAALMERFGLRRCVAGSLLVIAAAMLATMAMRAPWQLVLLWGVVVGGGTGMVALVLGATVAARWFQARRGLVMGVLTASTATGQLVFLPPLAALATTVGWRAVSLTLAVVALALVVPVMLLLRDRPADMGLPPFGGAVVEPPPPPGPNPAWRALLALRDGTRSRAFWLLAGSFFICGASTNGLIGTHLIPACVDHGIPEVQAAGLLAAMGVFDFFGTTASGWLSDRWDNRALLAWYYGLRGLSLLFLPFAFRFSFWGLSAFAVFYGLDWIATVPPTVRLASRAFGEENVAVMFGWIAAAHQLGAASAAWAAGALRVDTGNYLTAFVGAGALCLVASVMVSFIGAERERLRPAEAT